MRSYPSKYRLHSSLALSLSAAVGFFGFFPFFVGILLDVRLVVVIAVGMSNSRPNPNSQIFVLILSRVPE